MAEGKGRISRQSGGMIWEIVERQRRELLRGERQAAGEIVRAYGVVWQRIRGRLDELLKERAAAEAVVLAGQQQAVEAARAHSAEIVRETFEVHPLSVFGILGVTISVVDWLYQTKTPRKESPPWTVYVC